MWTWIKLATSSIGKFLLPFVRSFFTAMAPVVVSSATRAVQTVAQDMGGADWRERRDAAFDLVVKDLKEQGLVVGVDIAIRLVNKAIEAAVEAVGE